MALFIDLSFLGTQTSIFFARQKSFFARQKSKKIYFLPAKNPKKLIFCYKLLCFSRMEDLESEPHPAFQSSREYARSIAEIWLQSHLAEM